MSTLSKLFVVMILVLALVLLGVNATLFAMRADFKHKWVEESRHHYQTQMIKSAELAENSSRNTLLNEANAQLKTENTGLSNEIASLKSQHEGSVKELASKQNEIDKLISGVTTYGRQLEVQLQQISDAMAKVEEYKKRAADAFNKAATADQNRLYQLQESERLSKDLGSLENQYQELARDRQRLQETIAALNAIGVQTDRIAPRKALSGQVTAVAAELDLVVISIGRDAGVNEGDDFTVYRGSTFVGKVTIDRVDRAWASGRVTLKGKEEPRVGDTASNNVLATPGKSGN
jgi:hypothetical protein